MTRGQLGKVSEAMAEIAQERDIPELMLLALHVSALSLTLDPVHDAIVEGMEGIALEMTSRAYELQQVVNGTHALNA